MKNPTELDQTMADIVNAFLRWPLPESVSSDLCCNRPGKGRIGTNLLTCPETVAMVQEVIRPAVEKLLAEQAPLQLAQAHEYMADCNKLASKAESMAKHARDTFFRAETRAKAART